ncbi:hypothetical protein GCM10012285_64030 [Streptomyces kronopolitis]|uniref:Uncharacterized protein n=1 Tax=Streptomyces kronopolitis TaxID=1612435 RepID=A0ABQ2K3Y1_9ACTN|nr:hypothetical protein GCM10012285_64030 [Streptomyces kronopolitis]
MLVQAPHTRFEVLLLVVDGDHHIQHGRDLTEPQMLTGRQGTQLRAGRLCRHAEDTRGLRCHAGVVNLCLGYEWAAGGAFGGAGGSAGGRAGA